MTHPWGRIGVINLCHVCVSSISDLIRMIMKDAKNFDTRAWIVAVGIVLSTLVVLSLGICIVLYKEWQESDEDIQGRRTANKRTSSAHSVAFCFSFECHLPPLLACWGWGCYCYCSSALLLLVISANATTNLRFIYANYTTHKNHQYAHWDSPLLWLPLLLLLLLLCMDRMEAERGEGPESKASFKIQLKQKQTPRLICIFDTLRCSMRCLLSTAT